jgi:hypothetical protein
MGSGLSLAGNLSDVRHQTSDTARQINYTKSTLNVCQVFQKVFPVTRSAVRVRSFNSELLAENDVRKICERI